MSKRRSHDLLARLRKAMTQRRTTLPAVRTTFRTLTVQPDWLPSSETATTQRLRPIR